jgi:hypothetical protein
LGSEAGEDHSGTNRMGGMDLLVLLFIFAVIV